MLPWDLVVTRDFLFDLDGLFKVYFFTLKKFFIFLILIPQPISLKNCLVFSNIYTHIFKRKLGLDRLFFKKVPSSFGKKKRPTSYLITNKEMRLVQF